MDTKIQDAKRDGDIVTQLRLIKRSGQLYVDKVVETGATPEQVAEAFELQLPIKDQAILLAALYNHASPIGLGHLQATMEHIMSLNEAQIALMIGPPRFDYLRGRVIKVDVSDDAPRTDLYDRDNGTGAYSEAVRCKGCVRCT